LQPNTCNRITIYRIFSNELSVDLDPFGKEKNMPAERFYLDADLKGTVSLEGIEFHHLAHVMRVRIGEEIELVNGRGTLAKASVAALSKKGASLNILSSVQEPLPEPTSILGIPIMRPAKLELIIEKCTELGADLFWLYRAQQSEKEELSPNQLERLKYIAISAMKQCGRLDLPQIRIFSRLEELFQAPCTYLYGDTNPEAPRMASQGKVVFITGPERGFSTKEHQFLKKHATGVSLHKNTLRAETAPIVATYYLSLPR
jgi:16S rRNA (uracil1498-N3)-methyltransferase